MIGAYHLVSTIYGPVKVIHAGADNDSTKVFHGRYTSFTKAQERAEQLNEQRGEK